MSERIQSTYFVRRMRDEKEKLLKVDDSYYRYHDNCASCALGDGEEQVDGNEKVDEKIGKRSITDIKLVRIYENLRYKWEFNVHSDYFAAIIGTKGNRIKKITRETKTHIQIPKEEEEKPIIIKGSCGRNIAVASHKIKKKVYSIIYGSDDFTHVIDIPLNDEKIMSEFNRFRDDVLYNCGKKSEGVNEDLFEIGSKLHIKIMVLRLSDESSKEKAIKALETCEEKILKRYFLEKKLEGPLFIEVKGVDYEDIPRKGNDPSRARNVYAKIVDENGYLLELSNKIIEYFIKEGLTPEEFNGEEISKLKMELMRNRNSEKKNKDNSQNKDLLMTPRTTFDASNIIETHKETEFGKIKFSSIHLSIRGEREEDGYYKIATKIEF